MTGNRLSCTENCWNSKIECNLEWNRSIRTLFWKEGMNDKADEFGVSAVALDALERDFVEVMKELSAEDNLERFRLEYEKLHRALRKSHESEKRLIKKCQELNKEIMENAAKVQKVLHLSHDDENTILSLRKEIDKAWRMVDAAHEKESRAKDTIQMLKKEVNRLTQLVEQGATLTLGQESNLQKLIEEKNELLRERETHQTKVQEQADLLKHLQEVTRKQEAELLEREAEYAQRSTTYTKLSEEHREQLKARAFSESRAQDLHNAIDKTTKELEGLKDQVRRKNEDHENLEKFLKEEREKVHELSLKYERVNREFKAHTEMLAQVDAQNNLYKKDIPRLQTVLEQKDAEVGQARAKLHKMMKAVTAQDRELERIQQEKNAEMSKTSGYERRVAELMKDIDDRRRRVEEAERKVKDRVRDKNLNITVAVREEHKRVEFDGERTIEQGKNRSLEQELDAHRIDNQQLRKQTYELTRQKTAYHETAKEATERCAKALEQVTLGQQETSRLEGDLEEIEKKLKQQTSMYEQVLNDRNLYSKNLIAAQEEITDMKRRFKIMDHRIDQLKDDLRKREIDLCTAHSKHDKTVNDHQTAETRLGTLKTEVDLAKERGNALADEIKQLTQIIADCDTEKAKQQMKFNSVTNERNILATQLIRRNEELSLLYEKIRIQQSTLAKGEAQYHDRLLNIGMLRERVQDLRGNLKSSMARIRYVEDMKRSITTLQRQLIHERTKVKSLFEELQTPMNVHRWRTLDGSNPQEYENILKLQTLERRLIGKTEELRQKQIIIGDKEKQYNDLKNVLARQPGPEIAEQLAVYHDQILRRAEQIAHMDSELSNTRTLVDQFSHDKEKLQSELQDNKKKFYQLKSVNTTLVRERQLHAATVQPRVDGDAPFVVHQPTKQPRFAGGGFSLSRY